MNKHGHSYFLCLCPLSLAAKLSFNISKVVYIITQVILTLWLVLAYDLLKDRRTIDVIITKFFPPCFKMEESFENLDNILQILRDWSKEKGQKRSCRGIEQIRKAGRGKIKPFLLKNNPGKVLERSQ